MHDDSSARPLRADAERNRQRILAAAAEVFARRGLEAGLDEVAKHAGVGTGTVYRRFPDKALLIEALFESRIQRLLELAEEASDLPDAWEALEFFLRNALELQIADRGLSELFFGSLTADAVEAKKQLTPLFEVMLRRAKEAGQLRDDVEVTDLATMQIMLYTCGQFTADRNPDHWRRMLGLMLDALRARREGPTPLCGGAMSPLDFESACVGMKSTFAARPAT